MIGAILSSLDSMMNSAATIMTFDLYKKYVNPDASDKKLISIGRTWIVFYSFCRSDYCLYDGSELKRQFFSSCCKTSE